jgi:hypothetical protein
MNKSLIVCAAMCLSSPGSVARAQDVPAEYKQVLTALGKTGDYKANVLKVNIPRNDVSVTVAGVKTPTPFGFGGWVAMTKGTGGMDVMMGDLVLTQDEVNPVMSALLDNGIDVTALHNHFFRVDTARIAQIVGQPGEQSGDVYKITIGRDDLRITEMGASINARMGLNTWAAFVGTSDHAAIAGDVAMLAGEVTPVLKALRRNGLDVVAIHHHMTGTQPAIFFLHYWGTGPAEKLATGFKAALSELGKSRSAATKH